MTSPNNPRAVARVFFQEIEEGDRRKLEAASNDASTGGGARDLRIPHRDFWPCLRKLFPTEKTASRRRDGQRRDLTVYVGELFWVDASGEDGSAAVRSQSVVYEPPTDARPSEGRITKIHALPILRNSVPPPTQGTVFLLLIQQVDGKVFPHYVTETTLRDPGFNRDVATHIGDCIGRAGNRKVRGYIDFTTGDAYCHD